MKYPNRLSSTAGFSVLETVLAVLLISAIGIMGSRSLLNSTRSVADLNAQKRVATLADMVFQQYTSYALHDYNSLSSYDKPSPGVTASTFFNKPTNFGFDGISFTTVANYATNRTTATITLTETWHEGTTQKSAVFQKTYAATSQVGGGIIQVYVKNLCNSLTPSQPLQIIAQCPGLKGFDVVAPGTGGQSTTATTGADGQAYLTGVRIGASINVHVSAAKPSAMNVPDTSPSYVQGYYVFDPTNSDFTVTETTFVAVTGGTVNTIVITDFKAAGVIKGNVHNTATVAPPAPINGQEVELLNGFGAPGSADFVACTPAVPCKATTSGGTYAFYNVTQDVSAVYAQGSVGSDPWVLPTSSSFTWSCINDSAHSYPITSGLWTNTVPPVAPMDVYFTVLGWLNGTTINKDTAAIIPHMPITVGNINAGNTTDIIYPSSVTVTSDASGQFTLYNVEKGYGVDLFSGIVAPGVASPPSPNGLYVLSQQTFNTTGAANIVNVPISMGYHLSSIIHDTNSPPASVGMAVSGWGIEVSSDYPTPATTDNTSRFDYASYIPMQDGFGDPRVGVLTGNPFLTTIFLQNPLVFSPSTLSGGAYDVATLAPAPHATLHIWQGNSTYLSVTTDSGGNLSGHISIPYLNQTTKYVSCDTPSDNCNLCDTSSCPGNTVTTFNIDSSLSDIWFLSNPLQFGYVTPTDVYNPASGGSAAAHVPVALNQQMVQGYVRDAGGRALPGIGVGEVANGYSTDSAGHFGPFPLAVVNRTSPSNPGYVTINVYAQQGFNMKTETDPLPVESDPTIPQMMNIVLVHASGPVSSGGL